MEKDGPTGLTGPTGVVVTADNANLFVTTSTTAPSGSAITFDNAQVNGSEITFTAPSDTITLPANETYYVRYSLSSSTGEPYTLVLRYNGTDVSSSQSSSQTANTTISNGAILDTGAGGTLQLIVSSASQDLTLTPDETSLQLVRLS